VAKTDQPQWEDPFDLDMIALFECLEHFRDDDWEAVREIFRSMVGQRLSPQIREQLSNRLNWALVRADDCFKQHANLEEMLIAACGYPLGDEKTNSLSFALARASEKVVYEISVLRKAYGDWVDDVTAMRKRGDDDWARVVMDYSLRMFADESIPFVTIRVFPVSGNGPIQMSIPVASAFRLMRALASGLYQIPEDAVPQLDKEEIDSSLGRTIEWLNELVSNLAPEESVGVSEKSD